MARRVEDLALGLRVMTGPDSRDPFVVPMPLGDPAAVQLRGLRAAVFTENGVITPVREIVATVSEAAAVLRSAGVQVSEARPDGIAQAMETAFAMMTGDGGATLLRVLEQWGTDTAHSELRARIEAVTPMAVGEFTALLERMDRARAAMLPFLDRFDLIIAPVNSPSSPCLTAPRRSGSTPGSRTRWSTTFPGGRRAWSAPELRPAGSRSAWR